MDALIVLGGFIGGVATTLSATLAVLNIREKLWPKPTTPPPILHVVQVHPHPLEAALRDVAAAIRERKNAA